MLCPALIATRFIFSQLKDVNRLVIITFPVRAAARPAFRRIEGLPLPNKKPFNRALLTRTGHGIETELMRTSTRFRSGE